MIARGVGGNNGFMVGLFCTPWAVNTRVLVTVKWVGGMRPAGACGSLTEQCTSSGFRLTYMQIYCYLLNVP